MQRRTFYVPNDRGWELCLKRSHSPERLVPDRRPIVIVPGYGMNSFIFGYHPQGSSMVSVWVERGHEVWTADLRSQGASRRCGPGRDFGLADLALDDLRVALDFVLDHSLCNADRVIGVGCSLGGALLFGHVSCLQDHRVGALVPMGAPLRWESVRPLFRGLTFSPFLCRHMAIPHARFFASLALPLLTHIPGLLSFYLHADLVDLSHPERLLLTVNDLRPRLNEELSRWVNELDLDLRGCNVTRAFLRTRVPMLCVLAVGDGVVPEAAALSACRRGPGASTEVLRVGSEDRPWAHADLFVSRDAPCAVFHPAARWMETEGQGRSEP